MLHHHLASQPVDTRAVILRYQKQLCSGVLLPAGSESSISGEKGRS